MPTATRTQFHISGDGPSTIPSTDPLDGTSLILWWQKQDRDEHRIANFVNRRGDIVAAFVRTSSDSNLYIYLCGNLDKAARIAEHMNTLKESDGPNT